MRIERAAVTEAELTALAEALGRALAGGELIALEGALGSGKTRFVKGLARGLGLEADAVCSPSFIICRRHGDRLAHVDAFRLHGPEELATIGWDEMVADEALVIAVEWSNRIAEALPASRIDVTLGHAGPETRSVIIEASDDLADRLERIDERAIFASP